MRIPRVTLRSKYMNFTATTLSRPYRWITEKNQTGTENGKIYRSKVAVRWQIIAMSRRRGPAVILRSLSVTPRHHRCCASVDMTPNALHKQPHDSHDNRCRQCFHQRTVGICCTDKRRQHKHDQVDGVVAYRHHRQAFYGAL